MDTGYVAEKLKIPEGKIIRWENGSAFPTYRQLEKLAHKVFRLPLEVFFYPEPPALESPDVKLRALYREYLQETPTEMMLVMNNAAKMQEKLRELSDGKNPAENLITRKKIEGTIYDKAREVRELLSAPLEEQLKLRDHYKALKYWRERLANVGIYIFKENFENSAYSGFCLDDTEFPIIYLNSKMPPQRQIFTIFHELYHLLENRSGIDIYSYADAKRLLNENTWEIEKQCNEFAAEFLVPSDDFRHIIENDSKIIDGLEKADYSNIRELCINPLVKRYSVSTEMILLKLMHNKYLTLEEYEMFTSLSGVFTPSSGGGGDYYANTISRLGEPYVNLVREKQLEHGLEDYVVAEYLGVKTKSLEGIEKKLKGVMI